MSLCRRSVHPDVRRHPTIGEYRVDVRWLRLTGWIPGSIPGAMVALASASVICQRAGEALASNRKEDGMPRTNRLTNLIRRVISAIPLVGAGVGGNLVAGWLPAPA